MLGWLLISRATVLRGLWGPLHPARTGAATECSFARKRQHLLPKYRIFQGSVFLHLTERTQRLTRDLFEVDARRWLREKYQQWGRTKRIKLSGLEHTCDRTTIRGTYSRMKQRSRLEMTQITPCASKNERRMAATFLRGSIPSPTSATLSPSQAEISSTS